uniref:Uncharacterized protein n=1 Tax=Leersia perrieri TaxID=77586 RepID=A0A0D9WAY1_9ORYZ
MEVDPGGGAGSAAAEDEARPGSGSTGSRGAGAAAEEEPRAGLGSRGAGVAVEEQGPAEEIDCDQVQDDLDEDDGDGMLDLSGPGAIRIGDNLDDDDMLDRKRTRH